MTEMTRGSRVSARDGGVVAGRRGNSYRLIRIIGNLLSFTAIL